MLHLKIITPKKTVVEKDVKSITAPSAEGEITVLPKHVHFFTLLTEGLITIREEKEEEYLAIGGGYLETDGKNLQILVSRAYNQDEIDESLTEKALNNAKELITQSSDKTQRVEAMAIMRRSMLDLKLLRKRRRAPAP